MFGKAGIKPGSYVFAVQKEDNNSSKIIIGRVHSVNGDKVHVTGTYIRPRGLIERIGAGRAGSRPKEVLENPDPNNCIFLLIDRVESGSFNGEVSEPSAKLMWINERRFLVLDGWIKENLPDIFADVLSAKTEQERAQARSTLMEKMSSLYEHDLKEHMYAVARSAKIL